MCCVIASLFALGPRAAILLWWLVEPVRWGATFDTFLWPFVGFLILPWTTLMYVLVFPAGITGFDFVWLAIAVAMDVFSWAGGGYTNRDRLPTSRPDPPAGDRVISMMSSPSSVAPAGSRRHPAPVVATSSSTTGSACWSIRGMRSSRGSSRSCRPGRSTPCSSATATRTTSPI